MSDFEPIPKGKFFPEKKVVLGVAAAEGGSMAVEHSITFAILLAVDHQDAAQQRPGHADKHILSRRNRSIVMHIAPPSSCSP